MTPASDCLEPEHELVISTDYASVIGFPPRYRGGQGLLLSNDQVAGAPAPEATSLTIPTSDRREHPGMTKDSRWRMIFTSGDIIRQDLEAPPAAALGKLSRIIAPRSERAVRPAGDWRPPAPRSARQAYVSRNSRTGGRWNCPRPLMARDVMLRLRPSETGPQSSRKIGSAADVSWGPLAPAAARWPGSRTHGFGHVCPLLAAPFSGAIPGVQA